MEKPKHSAHSIEDVFEELHPRLWRGLVAFTASADLASEAEAEAYAQALARGDEIRDLNSWLWASAYRIARGLLAESSKQGPRAASVSTLTEDVHLVEFVSMLGELSEQQRMVVILRYVGGYKPAEIAEVLDTSPETVRVQLHRAHSSLRKTVGSHHD